MGGAMKSGSGDFLRVGEVFARTNRFAAVDDGRSHHTYQDGLPVFLRADVAAGLSAHRRHQFLEARQVQHPLEVIGQRRETPFALNLRQTLE